MIKDPLRADFTAGQGCEAEVMGVEVSTFLVGWAGVHDA